MFAVIIVRLVGKVRLKSPWILRFADDIVVYRESGK